MASNATSYRWQVSTGGLYSDISNNGVYGGATTTTLTITGATADMNGYVYRVIASGAASQQIESNMALLTVNSPPPSITSNPSDSTIAAGANTTFTVNASNATGYQWQVNTGSGFSDISNNGVYGGATTSTLTITGATAGMNGYTYRAVAKGAASPDAESDAAALTVHSPPSITSNPSDSTIAVGANTTFTVSASNATGYQWQVDQGGGFGNISNDGIYSGATTSTLSITGATADMSGYQYRVVAMGAVAPAATSYSVTLTVNSPPPSITSNPSASAIAVGANTTFSVVASNATSYQWQVSTGGFYSDISNDGVYSGATTATLTITGATADMSGYFYRAVASGNLSPNATSIRAELTVHSPPAITSNPSASAIAVGANTTFTVNTSNATGYQWQVNTGSGFSDISNSGVYGGTTTATLTITGATADMNGYLYRAVAKGAASQEVESNGAVLTVHRPPAIIINPSDSMITAGASTFFMVTATNATGYQWQVNTGSGFSDISDGGIYLEARTPSLMILEATADMNGYTYRVVVKGAASQEVESDPATLRVDKRNQNVSFTSTVPADAVVGGTYAVSATATSGLTPVVTVDAGSVAICSLAGGTVTFNAAGNCRLNANQAGDGTYAAATEVQQDITVGLTAQTVSFTSLRPADAVVGGTYAVSATATSGLTPVITVDAGSVAICSLAGGTVTFNAAGNCRLNANQAGDGTYAAATEVHQTVTIGQAAPQISGLTPDTGGSLGGSSMVISGRYLSGATSVTIGGTPVSSLNVDSDSQITVVVPAGTVGTADVVVTTPVDSFTFSGGYTYIQSNQALESFATVAANSANNAIVPDTLGEAPDSFTIYMAPTNGTATVSGATILYTPNPGFSGLDNIFFSAFKDGRVFHSTPPVRVTVTAPVLSVTPAAGDLPEGATDVAYSTTLIVANGAAPYSYVLKSGSLPNGLTLNGTTGAISGTPTTAGSSTFTVTITDKHLVTADVAYDLKVVESLSSDANLSGLTLSEGALSPAFASGTTSYSATVGNSVSNLTLTPAAADGQATLTVNGTPVTSGQTSAAIPLTVGANTIPVVVTAEDGTTLRTYTLNVTREALSADASLSGLTLSEGALSPAFASGTTSYSATVGNSVSNLTLTPAAADGQATLTVNGTPVTSGQASAAIPLNVGLNTIPVVVTAEDGTTLRTYTLSVTRDSRLVATPAAGVLPAGVPNDAYSATLSVSGGIGPYGFTVTAGALPDGLTLDATTGTISGVPETNGTYNFTIMVTDDNNATAQFSYSLSIAAPPAPEVVSPDATSVPANTSTQAGQSVNMNLSELVQGQYDDILIITPPQHGTVTLVRTPMVQGGGLPGMALALSNLNAPEQIVAVYTPDTDYQGSDSFQFVAVGPGGTSSPATVTIEVQGSLPTAPSRTVTVVDGQTVSVELTDGATEGPFTGASIVSVTPEDAVTVRIVEGGAANNRTYRMEITPEARFSGNIAVVYTLRNVFGDSASATITANVTARPDPSSDPTVRAISDAQVETARRFSRAQVANFMRRTESLHGLDCGASGSTVQVSAQSRPDGPRYEGDTEYLKTGQRRNEDDRNEAVPVAGRAATTPPASQANGSGAAASGARCANRFALWAGGTIDLSTYDAMSDRSKISASTSGLSFGADRQISKGLIVGAGFGFGTDTSKIAGGDARVKSESKIAAVYGSYTLNPDVFIDAVLVYGRLNFDTRRIDATTNLTVRGERDGWFTTGAVSVGYERKTGPMFWSVYSRGEYMTGSLDAYREQGAGIYDLRFDERELRSFTGVLGFRGSYEHEVSYGLIKTGLRAEWQHEFADSADQRLDYADIAGPAYYGLTTRGWAREQYLITPSLELTLPSGWQMGLEVGLRTAGKETSSSASFQLQKPF